jgi:hypothetical protein
MIILILGEQVFKKKRKKKQIRSFPVDVDNGVANPQMALADPANAASVFSGYAGLGSIGSINEDKCDEIIINNAIKTIVNEVVEDLTLLECWKANK